MSNVVRNIRRMSARLLEWDKKSLGTSLENFVISEGAPIAVG